MKTIAVVFPKDSDAFFNKNSRATFGGASVQLYTIAKELFRRHQNKVVSIINDYPVIDFADADFFNLVKTFRTSDNGFMKIVKFHRALMKTNPDVLIQRGLSLFSCLLALYCRVFGICFVFMFAHDREIRGRYQKDNTRCLLFPLLLGYASVLVIQNVEQKEQLSSRYAHKCRLVRSGTEIDGRKLPPKEFVLWVGRMDRWKRPEVFIEIAGKNPETPFLMIAPPVPGGDGYYHEIRKKAENVRNLTCMDFVHISEIDSYFERARVFVNTSTEEGFPNTFVQACKAGTPILSLTVNPSGVLDEYGCGFSCGNNVNSLDMRLKEVLKDEAMWKGFSNNAIEAARERHDIRHSVDQLLDAVNSICSETNRRVI